MLVAVAGGAVIALVAGARRADTAYPRFVRAAHAADTFVFLGGTPSPSLVRGIARLPEVRDVASARALSPTSTDFTPVVLTDPRLGREVNTFKLLAGRLPARPDEALVGFTLADSHHLHVGSTLRLQVPPGAASGTLRSLPVRVVGVEAAVREFPPLLYGSEQSVYLAPSFLRTTVGARWAQQPEGNAVMLAVRLNGGPHRVDRFLADVDRLNGGPVGTESQVDENANVQRSMHFQAVALWLVAGVGALVLLVILSQLLLRQVGTESADHRALRAIGMTSRELLGSDALRMAALGIAGAAGSVLVAWAGSTLFPLGIARVAEPSPGYAFDPLALGLGALAVALVVISVGTGAAWLVSRRRLVRSADDGVDNGTTARLDLRSMPVVPATGVRLAFRGDRGDRAVPVRTTVGAVAVGIGALAAALTFATSLGHLLTTPRLYGVTYDADVELNANFGDVRTLVPALRADPDVAAFSVADTGIPLVSGRTHFGGEALAPERGSVEPTLVDGRLPRSPGEIVLGTATMASLHTAIGRSIPVAVEGITRPVPMRVVGSGVFATMTQTESLGKGAAVAPSAFDRFLAQLPPGFPAPPPGDVFVRFQPGVSPTVGIGRLTARLGGIGRVLVTAPGQPSDVADFGQVSALPDVLAGMLAGLATATMAYLLVSAIRQRRRELAVLKTLGFSPRQVSAAVAWQATAVAVGAGIVGLPLGVVGGRLLWAAVARQVGVLVETQVPWIAVAVLVPAAILVANLVAAGPAAVASRIAPAQALRSE